MTDCRNSARPVNTNLATLQRAGLLVLATLVVGCASEIPHRSTAFRDLELQDRPRVVRVEVDTVVEWGSINLNRRITAGTVWRQVGQIPEGQVFRPVQGVFTIEGAHVHEAMLVLRGNTLEGFFLTHEKAYVQAKPAIQLKLTEGR